MTVAPSGSVIVPPPVDYGQHVCNSTAMKITAFYAGIRLISENIASLPRSVRRKTGKGQEAAEDHPAYRLVAVRPNDYTNTFDFWNCVTTWLEGWGNAYAVIRRGADGSPVSIHQVHPSNVTATLSGGKRWYRVKIPDPGLSWLNGTYSGDDMLHFMLLTLDGLTGVNPVIYNAIALGKNLATEKFGSEFYTRKGNIRAVLETDGNLGDDAYNKFIEHFKAASEGNNANQTWAAHDVVALFTFDGVEMASAALTCYVTGVPYRCSNFIEESGNWTASDNAIKFNNLGIHFYSSAGNPKVTYKQNFIFPNYTQISVSAQFYIEAQWPTEDCVLCFSFGRYEILYKDNGALPKQRTLNCEVNGNITMSGTFDYPLPNNSTDAYIGNISVLYR